MAADQPLDLAALAGAIAAAAGRVYPYVCVTPLEASPALVAGADAAGDDTRVFLKLESEQVTGSFKARGAVNKLRSLTPAELERGILTASTGNHGRGVAHALAALPECGPAARERAQIYVPSSVAPVKLAALRALGAPVVIVDSGDCVVSERTARAAAHAAGATFVSPYNDLAVVAGQGTAGAEIASQVATARGIAAAGGSSPAPARRRRPLVVVVPVGGGGLIAGVAGALKLGAWRCASCAGYGAPALVAAAATAPSAPPQPPPPPCHCAHAPRPREVVIIGSQPAVNPCMAQSVAAGRILPEGAFTDEPTLSDGTAGGIEEGSITWDACRYAGLSVADAVAAIAAARAACDEQEQQQQQHHEAAPRLQPLPVRLVDAILTVPEAAVAAGVLAVLDAHHKVVEGAAGTAVGVARRLAAEAPGCLAGCDVVALCCGGNLSTAALGELLQARAAEGGCAVGEA
jgi:threonine dehydratase